MSESETAAAAGDAGGAGVRRVRKYAPVLVLAAGVVVPGLVQFAVRRAGYPALADAAWVVGYGAVIVAVWWRWIRPLDLTGPSG